MLGERHVVRQARAGQRDRRVVRQPVVPVDHAVVHVGRVLRIVEEQQLAGALVDLGVRRDAVERHPASSAVRFQRIGVQPIALAALVEGREHLAGVHHHVGGGGVLQAAVRAPARPQRLPGFPSVPAHSDRPASCSASKPFVRMKRLR